MRKVLLLLFFGVGISGFVIGQSLDRTVLSSYWGDAVGGGMALEWTLGQVAILPAIKNDLLLTQGFHQPTLRVEPLDNENLLIDPEIQSRWSDVSFDIRPNPVRSRLQVNVTGYFDSEISVLLYDATGHGLIDQKVTTGTSSVMLDMERFAPGTYILRIVGGNDHIESHKIIKI